MKRTPVNPWSWSLNFGFNQAELLEGHTRQLICAGQTAVDAEGNPQHPGDMAGQLGLALDNVTRKGSAVRPRDPRVLRDADREAQGSTRATPHRRGWRRPPRQPSGGSPDDARR